MPIKYIGSKRLLVGSIVGIAEVVRAKTAADLFTGTTRVAQGFKKAGLEVVASDIATYSKVFADCYIALDSAQVDFDELEQVIERLNSLKGTPGFVTEEYCKKARYFQPHNGARIDAIRNELEASYKDSPLYPVLLTSLIEAADRVDSTVGLQMAYLKQWSKRSYDDMVLRVPELLPGRGRAIEGDVFDVLGDVGQVDLAYLDPPYNQHRYFTNYHVWETLVRWDNPEGYGIANKRIDARDESTKSAWNKKREMPVVLRALLDRVNRQAGTLVLSFNNESFVSTEELDEIVGGLNYEAWIRLDFPYKRYVGASIGIYSPTGQKVGVPGAQRNIEHIYVAGTAENVGRVEEKFASSGGSR